MKVMKSILKILLWIILLPILPIRLGWRAMRALQKRAKPDAPPEGFLFFSIVAFLGTTVIGYVVLGQIVMVLVGLYNSCVGEKAVAEQHMEQSVEQPSN